jgi:hypothetical protein
MVNKFTISLSKWGNQIHHWNSGSKLYDEHTDRYCCLGLYGLACGIQSEHLKYNLMPSTLNTKWPNWLFEYKGSTGQTWMSLLADINDTNLPLADKQKKIADIFAKHGVTVTFEE